jgi:hypothetical protein
VAAVIPRVRDDVTFVNGTIIPVDGGSLLGEDRLGHGAHLHSSGNGSPAARRNPR